MQLLLINGGGVFMMGSFPAEGMDDTEGFLSVLVTFCD